MWKTLHPSEDLPSISTMSKRAKLKALSSNRIRVNDSKIGPSFWQTKAAIVSALSATSTKREGEG